MRYRCRSSAKRCGALIATRGLLLERLVHDRLQVRIHPARAAPGARQRLRRLLADDPYRLRQLHPLHVERQLPRQHFVEHDAQRVDVRPQVDLVGVAAHLLRAHVRDRALHAADVGEHRAHGDIAVGDAGQAEVEDLDVGSGRKARRPSRIAQHEDVPRLEIPMDDASLVCVVHRIADLAEECQPLLHLCGREAALGRAALAILAQGLAPHELHGEEVLAVVGVAGLVDGGDTGVLQARQGLHFAPEHAQVGFIHVRSATHDLECDRTLGVLLLRLVHHTHAACAQQTQNAEITDSRWQSRRRWRASQRGLVLGRWSTGVPRQMIWFVWLHGSDPSSLQRTRRGRAWLRPCEDGTRYRRAALEPRPRREAELPRLLVHRRLAEIRILALGAGRCP